MADNILVYFITDGPVSDYLGDGRLVWHVQGQVSGDGGKTAEPMVFTFKTEEHALEFKRQVNYKMEPTIIGDEDE